MDDPETQIPDDQDGQQGDAPDYPPGTLCGCQVHPTEPVDLTTDEISKIKSLVTKIAQRDMPARREQIIRIWEARLFDRGFQHLLPRRNGGWTLPAVGSGYGAGEKESRSIFEVNIYSSYRKIITSALTREVPTVRFEPDDPEDDAQITAAEAAEKLKKKIERDNKMLGLQAEVSRFLWTDGLSVYWTRYIRDGQRFGWEPNPPEVVPEDSSREPQGEPGADQAGSPQISDTSGTGENSQPQRIPRGREVISAHGTLEFKFPIKANCLAECDYADFQQEIPICVAKATYPKKAKLIKAASGGPGGDDIDRLARVNVLLGVEDNFITTDSTAYDVTEEITWFRPASFDDLDDDTRDSFRQKFPNGMCCIFMGQEFMEAYDESMDDALSVVFADAGDGVHRPGIGQPLVPVQKVLNNWIELANDYFIRGVPQKWMDSTMFNVEALKNQTNVPGGVRPFQAPTNGAQVDGTYVYEERAIQFPDNLILFIQDFKGDLAQLLSGAFPALFGGDTGSNDTGMGIMMQRDQALGRIGLPWRNIKEAIACTMKQAVQCLARNHTGTIKLAGSEKVVVDMQDLKANFLCFPETSENFPESDTQRQNKLSLVVQDAATNPLFQQILDSPNNLELIKNGVGLEDLEIPMLESRDKQLGEIEVMLKSGPVPNPQIGQIEQQIAQLAQQTVQGGDAQAMAQLPELEQQQQELPPLVSTVDIDPDFDDHAAEFATCSAWINSPRGRSMKNGTPEEQQSFENIRLHALEHKKAMQAAQQPPQQKPPSVSMNLKDLPPTGASQAAAKAGLQVSPQEFVQQAAIEEATKHPTAPPVVQ